MRSLIRSDIQYNLFIDKIFARIFDRLQSLIDNYLHIDLPCKYSYHWIWPLTSNLWTLTLNFKPNFWPTVAYPQSLTHRCMPLNLDTQLYTYVFESTVAHLDFWPTVAHLQLLTQYLTRKMPLTFTQFTILSLSCLKLAIIGKISIHLRYSKVCIIINSKHER